MSEDQISPVSSQERIEILDVLRGLAVGGILIGNMQWFSGYGMMPPALAGVGGVIGYSFGVPALALGIIALVAVLWQKTAWQKALAFLAPVGRL